MSNGEEDISVKRVCEQSDLGVLFTLNFKFGSHIYYIAQKASQLISLIKIHLNVWMHLCYIQTLHTSLVHPYLDYVCVVWCPFQLGDIRVIERVQRSVTKIVPSLKDKS